MWLVSWCEPRRREQELSNLPPRLTTQHHPNMGTILDEMEEQRKKRILGGELEPFWMKGYLMTLCLLIGGPCPCPHPMESPLTPPDGISPQSSTPTADSLVMNVEEPNVHLHALVLRLPHGPDSVIPTRVLWQVPWDSVLVHHHLTTPVLIHHHLITPVLVHHHLTIPIHPIITPAPLKSNPDL